MPSPLRLHAGCVSAIGVEEDSMKRHSARNRLAVHKCPGGRGSQGRAAQSPSAGVFKRELRGGGLAPP